MTSSPHDTSRESRAPFRRRASAVLRYAVAAVLLGGCYRYNAVNEPPGAGADVRIHLTETGATSLAPLLGAGTMSVSGRIITASDSSLLIAVSETGRGDSRVAWAGERITVPRFALASAEHRSLDRWRTVGVGAIGVGAAAVVALLVNALGSGSGGDGDGPVVIPP